MTYAGPLSPTLKERFGAGLRPGPHGCIEWHGARNRDGYGMVSIYSGIARGAHQVAWFLHHGRWPQGLLMHSCDNRACCNPAHLAEGTQALNLLDASTKGRLIHGEQHHNARLTASQVAALKADRERGAKLRELATTYDISVQTASLICRGEVRANG